MSASTVCYGSSLEFLRSASMAFRWGNSQRGYEHFRLANEADQCRVYGQIWINRGRPLGNPEYGRETFWDSSIPLSEKANAIDGYMRPEIERTNPVPGRNERQVAVVSQNPPPSRRELTADDVIVIGITTGVVVGVTAGVVVASVLINALFGNNQRDCQRRT